MTSDQQKLRDAIEAGGLPSVGGSGPIYNDKRKNGTRRLKLAEAGYLYFLPQTGQYLIHDYLKMFFGERLVTCYFIRNTSPQAHFYPQVQTLRSLCLVLKD